MSWLLEVRVKSTAGALKAFFSNQAAGGAAILDLEYSRSRIGGCGELTLTATRARAQGHAVALGDIIEVWSSSTDEAYARRYRGMIVAQDTKVDIGTVQIQAIGFWDQFKWAVVVNYIELTDAEAVVADIWADMKAQTWCETAGSISIASPATLGDVEVTFQDAAEIIAKLAEIQGSVDYGVNEDGTFYFEDQTTTKQGHFQIGHNVTDMEIVQRMDDLYNDVFLKTRGIVSNGSLMLHRSDSTSITSYKKRTRMLDVPEFANTNNSITWGDAQITKNKAPVTAYSFTPILSTEKHFPYRGTVGLVDEDGVAIGTVAIEGVTVKYDENGFTQKLDVGDIRAAWNLGSSIADIDREILLLKTSGISATKIAHSGFEAFTQYVYEHAFANGFYNVLVSEFEEDAV
jgi:hypothetical protein